MDLVCLRLVEIPCEQMYFVDREERDEILWSSPRIDEGDIVVVSLLLQVGLCLWRIM